MRINLLIWPTQNFGRFHFRPKVQALEKKGWEIPIVLTLFRNSRYRQKLPKKFKRFSGEFLRSTLHKNVNKVFEKKQKWQNLTSFWKIFTKFISAYFWNFNALKYAVIWQKNGQKWQLCFTPWIIAKNDQKNSKIFLVNV